MDDLTADLHKRSTIPKHVEVMIRSFPKDMHAMSMFGAALFAMQACYAHIYFHSPAASETRMLRVSKGLSHRVFFLSVMEVSLPIMLSNLQ